MISEFENDSLSYISRFVRERSAIELDSNKAYLIESRLAPVIREHNLGSIDGLVIELRKPGKQHLAATVVEAMTTNETTFFRDIHPFNLLRNSLLPRLIDIRSKDRSLVIWSNACSSGQEAFSIAMLIREYFPAVLDWKVRIIASDISNQILDKARTGSFNQAEVNRGLPAPLLIKYFKRQGMCWKLSEEILKMVEFCNINLVEPLPGWLPKIDIVMLRNVLIYFSPATKSSVLNKVSRLMTRDSVLFLGGAETTLGLSTSLQRQQAENTSFYTCP